jgi:hypothetical protein
MTLRQHDFESQVAAVGHDLAADLDGGRNYWGGDRSNSRHLSPISGWVVPATTSRIDHDQIARFQPSRVHVPAKGHPLLGKHPMQRVFFPDYE